MAEAARRAIRFEQPVEGFPGRAMNGSLEHVDFIPRSHMRIWHNTQDEIYPPHHHNALEIILCTENAYCVRTGETVHHLQTGDILFIPPHVLHELRPEAKGSRFIFLIDLDPFRDLPDFQAYRMCMTDYWLCRPGSDPLLYPKIYAGLMEMANAYFESQLLWEGTVYVRLMDILLLITRHHLDTQASQAHMSRSQYNEEYGKLSQMLQWLDEHYAEKVTQEQAADVAGFSRFYFSRLFRQVTGSTFPDYLSQRRVTAAQKLLSTDCPITDIAFQTGFSNVSSFNRCFKKYAGCSPSEYRLRYRKEHEIS